MSRTAILACRGEKRRIPAFSVVANPQVHTPYAPHPSPMGTRSSLGPRAACFSPRHRGSHPSALLSPLLVLSAVLMLGGEAWPAPARVAILENVASVEVSAERGIVVSDPQSRRPHFSFPNPTPLKIVAGRGQGLEVGPRLLSVSMITLEAIRGGILKIGQREYSGLIDLYRVNGGLLVVNELPLEEYVVRALRGEMSEKWPLEALKAQAVAIRTYTVYHQLLNQAKVYHLAAGTQYQNYAGRVNSASPLWVAVRETQGQVLTLGGQLVVAFYHTDSGGWTERSDLVFSGEMPRLNGIRDEFSVDSPHARWALELPLRDLRELLRRGGIAVGEILDIEVVDRSESLRVQRLEVRHTQGTTPLRGVDFRRLVGYDTLKSTLFAVSMQRDRAIFQGRGWGHGVGLSQYGAKEMGERGYGYRDILVSYYSGTVLASLDTLTLTPPTPTPGPPTPAGAGSSER